MELPKQYDPAASEARWYAHWEENGYFKARPDSGLEPYAIVIPPPNVTGVLHTGHAMFVTLQDILIRWKRMQGYDALWVPGTDHAGIATQMVVSKELEKQGLRRHDLGRDEFIEKVWEWRRDKGDTILLQLRRLGASCDWSRTRFTLDPDMSKAVRKAFVDLYREGLIYRGRYMINWCSRCGTALSDLEVEHVDTQGSLWYIRYPLQGGSAGEGVVVATTRPETMLGDTAVAVHPEDSRYRHLIGKQVTLPILKRAIPVIADSMVDREFGTGAVKITPAHDPNDFEAGKRHNLPQIQVIGLNGSMTSHAGPYEGQDRFAARKAIVKRLEADGLLVKVEPHQNAVGHCQRCDCVVEPAVSNQWFLKIEPLAKPAREVVERGEVRIIPEHWQKVYLNWMSEIHDWCISRQIWWGHRIPAFYCDRCGKAAGSLDPDRTLVAMEDLTECPYCGGPVHQDTDVLDTWFSSQLWPFSTMGWPENTQDLERYYPSAVLETGYDILFFWVARMIMAGIKFTGKPPFRDEFLHGLVRDAKGRKMSKTLGNVIDPLELIDQYGADAVRFTLAVLTVPGTDVALDTKRMEGYRAFANKLWNAGRFVLMQIGETVPPKPAEADLSYWDGWILEEYEDAVRRVNLSLADYKFYEASDALYHFVWHRFCDWYVEVSKVGLGKDASPERQAASRWVLAHVLDGVLRLLHPFMPFITEELWQRIPGSSGTLVLASYPLAQKRGKETRVEGVEALMDLVNRIRNLKAERGIAPGLPVELKVAPVSPDAHDVLSNHSLQELVVLARLSSIEIVGTLPEGADWAPGVSTRYKFSLSTPQTVVDTAAERRRLEGDLKKALAERDKFASKLASPSFAEKAPAEVVEKTRRLLKEFEHKVAELEASLARVSP
jgi:valyl-tRNA synthetase